MDIKQKALEWWKGLPFQDGESQQSWDNLTAKYYGNFTGCDLYNSQIIHVYIQEHNIQISNSDKIELVFDSIKELVLEKNKRYGSSALEPLNIFCKLENSEGILQRLDDKLNRIKNSSQLRKNDISDMIGYLGLLCITKDWLDFSEFID